MLDIRQIINTYNRVDEILSKSSYLNDTELLTHEPEFLEDIIQPLFYDGFSCIFARGVYLIVSSDQAYIGQTKMLYSRLRQHFSKGRFSGEFEYARLSIANKGNYEKVKVFLLDTNIKNEGLWYDALSDNLSQRGYELNQSRYHLNRCQRIL